MKTLLCAAFALVSAGPIWAQSPSDDLISAMKAADVVILGEIHDNPDHHAKQAQIIAELAPKAVVYEMLTAEKAQGLQPGDLGPEDKLRAQLEWETSGWPDFSMYYPVLAAGGGAQIFGAAIPRSAAAHVSDTGIAAVFGAGAAQYGLADPLPQAQQSAREAYQMAAHCDALPDTMLPMMVDFQRLRDASLTRAVMQALEATGGPVAVITGNGHARRDWGMPVYLDRIKPGLSLFVLGQTEEGADRDGVFDAVLVAPPAERPDPCEQFTNKSD